VVSKIQVFGNGTPYRLVQVKDVSKALPSSDVSVKLTLRNRLVQVKDVSKALPFSDVSVKLTLRNNPEELNLQCDQKVSVHLMITTHVFLA
jgi:hypothetical protein